MQLIIFSSSPIYTNYQPSIVKIIYIYIYTYITFTTKWTIYISNKLQIIIWYFINLYTNLHNPILSQYKNIFIHVYIYVCVYIYIYIILEHQQWGLYMPNVRNIWHLSPKTAQQWEGHIAYAKKFLRFSYSTISNVRWYCSWMV